MPAGRLCHACCHHFLCIHPVWLSIRRGGLLRRCQAVPVLHLMEAGCTRRGSRNCLRAALLCWGRPTYRGGQQGGAGLLGEKLRQPAGGPVAASGGQSPSGHIQLRAKQGRYTIRQQADGSTCMVLNSQTARLFQEADGRPCIASSGQALHSPAESTGPSVGATGCCTDKGRAASTELGVGRAAVQQLKVGLQAPQQHSTAHVALPVMQDIGDC